MARKKVYQAQLRQRIWDYLSAHPCVECSESDPIVLEFDHLDPETKIKSVSVMVQRCLKWQTIQEEIDKCQVLCANCHRRKTAKDQGWYALQVGVPGVEPDSQA